MLPDCWVVVDATEEVLEVIELVRLGSVDSNGPKYINNSHHYQLWSNTPQVQTLSLELAPKASST